MRHLGDLEDKSINSSWLSLIYVPCDGESQGVIQYADPLRTESPALIIMKSSENCEFGAFFGQLNLYTISGNFDQQTILFRQGKGRSQVVDHERDTMDCGIRKQST